MAEDWFEKLFINEAKAALDAHDNGIVTDAIVETTENEAGGLTYNIVT